MTSETNEPVALGIGVDTGPSTGSGQARVAVMRVAVAKACAV